MNDKAPAHSPVGASGYYRWKHCPGSVNLSKGIESKSSVYAEEGTVAHDLAYRILCARRDRKPEPDTFDIDDEMLDFVGVYVDHMIGLQRPGCIQLYEHRFHLSDIHELCFGTADGVTYYPDEELLVISDLKYGAGVYVEVEDNEQLLYYALGAVLTLGFKVKRIRVEIIQPRIMTAAAIRPWETDIFDLWMFAAQLRIDVAKTQDPRAPLVAGDWCRWCPAAAICPLLKEQAKELTKKIFADVKKRGGDIDYDDLGETLKWLPIMESWITNTREFAYAEALRGKKIKDHKVVNKKAQRRYKDEEAVAAAVYAQLKLDAADKKQRAVVYDFPQPKLRSPAQLEAAIKDSFPKLKKADIKEFVDALTEKISSGTTLVHVDDDREEVVTESAKSVFRSTVKVIDPLS